ncbi:MAG: D-alanine--D-alanine ligase [Trueperaceae bacterium]|nr:MAG: D-alanine--D-alanine ligase [Trueperaceae bacterium]
MKALRVLLLCGGQSEEHEVSLASARSVLEASGEQLELTPLVIDRSGHLLSRQDSLKALTSGETQTENLSVTELPQLDRHRFDIVFPLLHGPFGEDGSVQGLLRLMGLPHVGAGVLGSAVGMDKLVMKSVFGAHGFPQVGYRGVTRYRWNTAPKQVLEETARLGFPLFIKPANLGSSIGITKAEDEGELQTSLETAFEHDRRVIVEQGLNTIRELEVAVLGNDAPEVSPVGEIRYDTTFYDYETKYTEGEADLIIPAAISKEIEATCQDLSRRAFLAIDCAGLARVDFFYQQESGEVYLNEINTIPGFTETSMYPRLWQAAGLSYPDLITKLLELALEPR